MPHHLRADRTAGDDQIGAKRGQLLHRASQQIHVVDEPAYVELEVASGRPPQCLQAFAQRRQARLRIMIGLGKRTEHADAAYTFALLCAHRERPRSRRTTDQRDELAPLHAPPRWDIVAALGASRNGRPMSALGHSRRFWPIRTTSALPPIATAERTCRIGR